MPRKRTGSIQKRGDSYRISYYDLNGVRQWETICGHLDEAQKQLNLRLGDLAKGIPVAAIQQKTLFKELLKDVSNDYKVQGFRSYSDIEARIRLHIGPRLGERRASAITTAELNQYILDRRACDPAPATGTINRELEAIRHAFKMGIRNGKIQHAPHVPHLRENNTRSGFFTREEVDRLCGHLKDPLRSFVLFAFLTGWRREEIAGLEWRSVDFASGEIRLDPGTTKNGDGRVFPMHPELRALLQARKDKRGVDRRVFAGVGEFRRSWRTACHKAGLPCVVEPCLSKKGKPMKRRNGMPMVKVVKAVRIFHDLRRSAAKYMQSRGLSEGVIMALMGHKTRSMFDRYNVIAPRDLREAAEKLGGANDGAKSGFGTA